MSNLHAFSWTATKANRITFRRNLPAWVGLVKYGPVRETQVIGAYIRLGDHCTCVAWFNPRRSNGSH